MTKEKLLSLIESWQRGDCPGEILNDAILDFGIDTSRRFYSIYGKYWILKSWITGYLALNGPRRFKYRRTCRAILDLIVYLKRLP